MLDEIDDEWNLDMLRQYCDAIESDESRNERKQLEHEKMMAERHKRIHGENAV